MEQLKAVILAAGKGTRMKSDLPKVVHTIEGKCLVDYAIEAAIGAGADDICLVVGYKYEVVRETILHQEVNNDPVWGYAFNHGRNLKAFKRISHRE